MRALRSWQWSVVWCGLATAIVGCGSEGATTGARDGATGDRTASTDRPAIDGGLMLDAWGTPSFDIPGLGGDAARTDGGADAPDALPVTMLADGGVTACGPRERCGNGIDDDCNGMTDEECACVPGATQPCYPGDPLRAGRGVCNYGTQRCSGVGEFGTWSACAGFGTPQPPDCRMPTVDRACDGNPGAGCLCAIGTSRSCYSGPAGTQGRGLCRAGTQTCAATATGSAWGACAGEVRPSPDTCDGRDTDCDGAPNTGCGCTRGQTRTCYSGAAGTAGRGLCRNGTQTCVATISGTGTVWGPCAGEVVPAVDVCNGIDRNCDGNPNTGCACTIDASEACYTGPAATRTVAPCRPGTRRCNALVRPDGTLTSVWGACLGQVLPGAAEVCGNMVDDNCSGMADEGCSSCAAGSVLCAGRCIDVRSDVANCGACGNVCPSGQACANGVCVGSGMLRVTMTWDRPGDMDLHVVPPCMQAISFRATNRCGGQLDRDDTSGTGPENVFWAAAPERGTYLVCAVPFRISGPTAVTVTVNQGTMVRHTWPGTRTASDSGAVCTRESPYFLGSFDY